ncbi:TonB-dependent receptor [Cytophaga sp. FL35]|uniref:TonB-dependent receptor plug domain-containing protein n=1 Tax=Cytophaga sp. FL35 TaxID=1904456 RepID=UPI0016539CF8|nr:TonB-dependent receptor [Cytophaga sp. FL35]MBC6997831.1 TonB-dependent receptor [Cytophaga sp. FL35]
MRIYPLLFLCLSPFILWSQEEVQFSDSTRITELDEVVLTGESKVLSVSKKLFRVETIDSDDIKQLAGNTLADVLNQNLNITVTPNPSTGRSTISMFGLDGQYVKILLDGIPLASDNGMGNNIDITQINLEEVERIEIVEGAMGVLYGDNAVAGVINIVSKSGLKGNKWAIRTSLQEESVGSEYAWTSQGRHIQNFRLSHQLFDATQISGGISRNDYAGFFNDFKGQNYVNIQGGTVVNDGLRGMEWNPKEQLTTFVDVRQKVGKHTFYLKSQYFDEELTIYNHLVNGRLNSNGEPNPTANDQLFNTHRWVNNLNIAGSFLGPTTYNLSLSYQNQKRYVQEYTYNILQQGIEAYTLDQLNQSSDVYFSKGTINNILAKSKRFNLLTGYEVSYQRGFDALASGNYSTNTSTNTLENYDLFAHLDVLLSDRLSVYPGMRVTNNSQFGNQLIWSFSSNYDLENNLKLKAIFGSAFRAPNFEEFFYYFVDSNHNVQGNPDLQPEDGISIFLNADKKWMHSNDNALLSSAFRSFYFNLKDKIALVGDDSGDVPRFLFNNVNKQQILGFSLNHNLRVKRLQLGLGATYLGESLTLSDSGNGENSDYVWSLNLNSNVFYEIPRWNTTLSAQLKYTGRALSIVSTDDNGMELDRTDAFTWLDTTAHIDISPQFDLTFGVRNLMDIVSVDASNVSTGAHGVTGSDSQLFGNGRSYFLKLSYLLTFN